MLVDPLHLHLNLADAGLPDSGYLAGEFGGDLALTSEGSPTLGRGEAKDAFVLKLGASTASAPGGLLWASALRGEGDQVAFDMTTDAERRVYVAGQMNGALSADGLEASLPHQGGEDVWLVQFAP